LNPDDPIGALPPEAAVLVRRGERYRAWDPARGIVCEADDVASAFRALEETRQELAGGDAWPAPPTRPARDGGADLAGVGAAFRSLAPLGRPLAFLLAVLLGIAVSQLGATLGRVGRTVSTFADTHRAGRAALDRLHALAQAAETLSPERTEQIRRDLRSIVTQLAPITAELGPLLPAELRADGPGRCATGEGGADPS